MSEMTQIGIHVTRHTPINVAGLDVYLEDVRRSPYGGLELIGYCKVMMPPTDQANSKFVYKRRKLNIKRK